MTLETGEVCYNAASDLMRLTTFFVILAMHLATTGFAGAETIRVGTAASLREAMTEVAQAYQQQSEDEVELVFGSSGRIMAQIRYGAPIDLFISASETQIATLLEEQKLDPASRRIIARGELVLVEPAGADSALESFAGLEASSGRIAMGEPRTVPAGLYARQLLDSMKLWESLAGRVVYGANVRQVLSYVERGEVVAGIVYATDARESGKKVRVVARADPRLHDPIVYPAAVVTASGQQPAAWRLLEFLETPAAQEILQRRGFELPDPPQEKAAP